MKEQMDVYTTKQYNRLGVWLPTLLYASNFFLIKWWGKDPYLLEVHTEILMGKYLRAQ